MVGGYWTLNHELTYFFSFSFFFFDSFGVDGLKSFIIQDKKVIEKILFRTEQLTRTDNKITLVNVKFFLFCSIFWK